MRAPVWQRLQLFSAARKYTSLEACSLALSSPTPMVALSVCFRATVSTESFLDLSLELKRVSTLQGALRNFTARERMVGENMCHCEACGDLTEAQKQLLVSQTPHVLALQVKRPLGCCGTWTRVQA